MIVPELSCQSIRHDRILHLRISKNRVTHVKVHADNEWAVAALKGVEDHRIRKRSAGLLDDSHGIGPVDLRMKERSL